MDLSRLYPNIDKAKIYDIDYLKSLNYLTDKDIKRQEKYIKAKLMLI